MSNAATIDLSHRDESHLIRLVRDLWEVGWNPVQLPESEKIEPNRQLFELRTPQHSIRLRIAVYKVGDRGESHRRDERRIEITTTYPSGLKRLRRWADVVLGYDPSNDVYVGIDPRRLALGGSTHNASSSVDPSALSSATDSRLIIRPHETRSFGLEYQGIFGPERLSEYLFNYELIHAGRYSGTGLFSGRIRRRAGATAQLQVQGSLRQGTQLVLTHGTPTIAKKRRVSRSRIEAFEVGDLGIQDLSPSELEAIQQKCREVGHAAEYFVYQKERKRLIRAGKHTLADKVTWVSQDAINKGYDIRSFETSGQPRYIEVKATVGDGKTFFLSNGEWKCATQLRNAYWIYRVINALDAPTVSVRLQDPVSLEQEGVLKRVADGWRVTLS